MSVKIKFNNPFSVEGNWYKGNLHTHTTNSDGELSPEDVISSYCKKGYDFLVITDHNKLTKVQYEPVGDGFIRPGGLDKSSPYLIPGEEIDGGKSAIGTSFHIIALNIKKEIVFANKEEITAQEIIDRIREEKGEAIIAHPYWSGLTLQDILPLKNYLGIEVFNSDCLYGIGKGESSVHWDNLLTRDKQIFGFAVDDTHHYSDVKYRPMDMGKGWIMVKALNKEVIMESIKKGLFYSSSGPIIKNLSLKEKTIKVETSPVSSITFFASPAKGKRFTALSTINQAEYEIKGNEKYIRIECADTQGRKSWTNPLFISLPD